MTTKELHGQTQVTPGETARAGPTSAAVVGSALGGVVGGLVLLVLTQFHVSFVGSMVGLGAMPGAFAVWMGVAVVLGLGFASIAGPAINVYYSVITSLTARSASLRQVLLPLITRSALGTTAAGLGIVYGLFAGLLVGAVLVPATAGAPVPPAETGSILIGYAFYGTFLGLGYGLTLEGGVPVPSFEFVSPAAKAAVIAPIAAGAISGAIVYSQQTVYLVYLGLVVGAGSATGGFALWMVLTFAFGQAFAMIAQNHAARGNGTAGYGAVYGVVLAVFFGLLAIPAVVTATTGWDLPFDQVRMSTLLAFVAYGLILGSVFGKVINGWPLRPRFLVGRTRANVLASLLAGALSGLVLYARAPVYLSFFLGEMVGAPGSAAAGFAAWIGIAVLLGMGFGTLPAKRIESAEHPGESGLKMGTLYGALVALPVGMLVAPAVISATTQWEPATPFLGGPVLLAYILVGVVHGVAYGALRGTGSVMPRFLQGRAVPILGGAAAGGALGAAAAYALSPNGIYLVIVGGIVGSASTTGGLAVWFAMALLLGLLFVPLAGRSFEADPTVTNALWIGASFGVGTMVVVGMLAVPSLTGIDVPHTKPPIAGYFVFGLAFGGVYGALRRRTLRREEVPTSTSIGSRGHRAVVFGSLFGGVVGGLVIHHAVGPVAMRFFAVIVGAGGSEPIGWGVWLALSLVLGGIFSVVIAPRLKGYSPRVDRFEGRDETAPSLQRGDEEARALPGQVQHSDNLPVHEPRSEASPAGGTTTTEPSGSSLDNAPFTTSATIAGLGYGVVAAVAVGALAFPVVVNTATAFSLPSPLLNVYFLLGFVAYGLFMGLGYGVYREF